MRIISIPLLLSALILSGCVTTNSREASCKTLDAVDGTYDGGCRNGLAHGKGTYFFSQGDRYIGDFVDGFRTGQGTLTFGNGTEQRGTFVKGEFKGKVDAPQSDLPAADAKKVTRLANDMESNSATFEPIDKAAYYLDQRKKLENQIRLFRRLLVELPSIEQKSIAAGATKFPDVKNDGSLQGYVQKFLHNASNLKESADKRAYFQLLKMNLGSTVANSTKLLSEVDSVLEKYTPEVLARANTVMEDNKEIDKLLLAHKNSGEREAIKRAYDLASTDQQRRRVEAVVIASLQDKQLIVNTRMEASGKVQSSGGSELTGSLGLGRSVSGTVTSLVKYEAMFDTSIYKPHFDYKVEAKVRIEVAGRVRGWKPCGLMLVSNCEFDNPDVKYFNKHIELALTRSNGYKDRGEVSIDWSAVSGGSGLASGMLFGGAHVFNATDEPRLKVLDISVESLPRSTTSATESVSVKAQKGAAHPIDMAFTRAARSTKVSKSTVASGVLLDMSNAMGDAKRKTDAVDEKINQNRSGGFGSISNSSGSSSSGTGPSGGWKLIKQYEGGVADFGLDTRRTIFLIKCNKGGEHKMYQDGRGKWGTTGAGWNNAASSLDEAAKKQCS